MDFKIQKRSIEILYKLLDGKNGITSYVTYEPQKVAFCPDVKDMEELIRATPESQGISSRYIQNLLQELEKEKEVNLHNIMIARNGCIIAEGSFYPYQKQIWQAVYSLSKSVTGMAIGMLIEEGKLSLEDRVVDLLKPYTNSITYLKHKSLTVRHLLTMSSGVLFNETGAIADDDWIRAYLESNNKFSHGTQFSYNSMNSYLLSAIVTEICKMPMMEYLRPRLWDVLGIHQVYWEVCPQGINKGGWGLYLTIEGMVKLGQLMLQKGIWHGKRILSEEWVTQATQKQIDTGEENGYAYGYHNWVSEKEDLYLFNGMLGQNVIVYPEKQMVIATTSGNDELFMDGPMVDKIQEYFGGEWMPEQQMEENFSDYQSLKLYEAKLGRHREKSHIVSSANRGWKRRRISEIKEREWKCKKKREKQMEWFCFVKQLNGICYKMETTRGAIVPVFWQTVHNNYSEGIQQIRFSRENGKFFWHVLEGVEEYRMEIGMGVASIQTMDYHGEPYCIAVTGMLAKNEEEITVLKIEISFLETPHTRMFKIFFETEEEIRIVANEKPGKLLIRQALNSVMDPEKAGFIQNILSKLDPEFFQYKLRFAIEPEITGKKQM